MNVEIAFNAIKDWYDGESFHINGITESNYGIAEDFEQSSAFLSVTGYQNQIGMDGDAFEGKIYFEYEAGKYIETSFYM